MTSAPTMPDAVATPAAATTAAEPSQLRSVRRVATASLLGTAIEWYDFFIYGMAAALVFGDLFFPSFSALAGTLASFATFAVGFLARPLGGIVMGHFGDRVGRKSMLVASLVLMGAATFGIGLLPGYAEIGVFAPVLLVVLRFLQGFGVGGEWGGAVLMSTEHAPAGRRGFFGSFPQMGVPAGVILANGVFLLATSAMSDAAFEEWGWRLPFLLSAVLVAVGLVVRLRVAESPVFEDVKQRGATCRMPIVDAVRRFPREIVLAAGAYIATNAIGYIIVAYLLSYGTKELGLDRDGLIALVLVASFAWLLAIGAFAAWSDRIGRRRIYIAGAAALVVWSVPFFALVDTRSPVLILVALLVMVTALGATFGPQAAMYAEMFPSEVRYSGASLGFQIGAILGGGLAPTIATALYAATGTSLAVGGYLAVSAVISLVSVFAIGETAHRRLDNRR